MNLRNEPENIVRMDRVKIVTRYTGRWGDDEFDTLKWPTLML